MLQQNTCVYCGNVRFNFSRDDDLGMEPQEAFETVCEHLGIKVRYL